MWKITLALSLLAAPLSACRLPFEPTLEAATAKAVARDLPILMLFTGSDWSLRSVTLDKELLENQAIEKILETSFILMMVDFPQRLKLAATQQSANTALAEKFQVSHFPTLISLRPDGSEIGRLEFHAATVDSMTKTLNGWLSQAGKTGQGN